MNFNYKLMRYLIKNAYMALYESQKKLEENKKKEPNYHYVDFDLKHSEEYIKGYKDCETKIKEKIDEAMLSWKV